MGTEGVSPYFVFHEKVTKKEYSLEQRMGKYVMTEFSVLGELALKCSAH